VTPTTLPPDELTATAIRVLCREIGLANTARFLRQVAHGQGDYTREREQLFGALTMDEIVAEIKRRRESSEAGADKGIE